MYVVPTAWEEETANSIHRNVSNIVGTSEFKRDFNAGQLLAFVSTCDLSASLEYGN